MREGQQGSQPPASLLGTASIPNRAPLCELAPFLLLGRHPSPSRNWTRLDSAFEPPQEGSTELPTTAEPLFAPIRASPSLITQGAVMQLCSRQCQCLISLCSLLWFCASISPCLCAGSWWGVPSSQGACEMLEQKLTLGHVHGFGTGPRGRQSSCKVMGSSGKGRRYF